MSKRCLAALLVAALVTNVIQHLALDKQAERLNQCSIARDAQAARLAAFMEESDYGVTPAEIIESLQSKVRGIGRANATIRGQVVGYRESMAKCGCEEEFAGPESKRPPAGGGLEQDGAGPAIRLGSE